MFQEFEQHVKCERNQWVYIVFLTRFIKQDKSTIHTCPYHGPLFELCRSLQHEYTSLPLPLPPSLHEEL